MEQTYKTVTEKVPYAKPFVQYVEGSKAVQGPIAEYEENRNYYRAGMKLKSELRKALRGEKGSQFEGIPHDLADPLYVIAVASIKTPTEKWEKATAKWLDGKYTLREYLGECQDTKNKIECIEKVRKTDILERTNKALRGHHTLKAVKILSGKEHNINTYLKGAKAWMVPTLLFGVGCLDTNVHTAIRPMLMWNLENKMIHHPSMSENAKGQARAKAKEWPSGKIPPYHKDWIDRRVSRYNEQEELAGLWEIVETIMKDRIPASILPQVLFNIGGMENNPRWNRTVHEEIYEALGRNLEDFR